MRVRTVRIVPIPIAPCLVLVSVAIIRPKADEKMLMRTTAANNPTDSLMPNSGKILIVATRLIQISTKTLKAKCWNK